MNINKQLITILVLGTLLLSAIGVSVYFYFQSKDAIDSKQELIKVYVAKTNIKKNILITSKHIKITNIPKTLLTSKVLTKNEIVDKYAKEAIYTNELFLKEKLSLKKPIIKVKKVIKLKPATFKYNSYNLKFDIFENPDYSIKINDLIKIVSVYQKNQKAQKSLKYSVQYVTSKNIKIIGFLHNGELKKKAIDEKSITKVENGKKIITKISTKADELVLDIEEKVLLSFIKDYNMGKQVWMVKTKELQDELTNKNFIIELKSKKVRSLDKIYPMKWYKPKKSMSIQSASIKYSNNKNENMNKKVKITSNFIKQCSQKTKLLLVKTRKIYLRSKPSKKAKIYKKLKRNYILPYISLSRINNAWYRLCDGTYVHTNYVSIIKYDKIKNKYKK